MNVTKRVTAWFLTLVMVLGMIPQIIFAEEKTASPLEYEIEQKVNEDKTEAVISLKIVNTETIQLEKVTLPDGTEQTENLTMLDYTVSENGTYKFTVHYAVDSVKQEEPITVEISGLLEKKSDKETPDNAKKDINSSELKTNGLQVSGNSYEVSNADELNTILEKIKNSPDTEAKIVLTADITIKTEFAGVKGKNIILQSKGPEKHSFNLSETMQGDVVLDNVKLANDEKNIVYANGNKFETTANFQGTIHNIYGGGNENAAIVGDTYLILRGGTFSSIYGGGYNSTVTGDTHITFDGATIEPEFSPNKKRIVGGGYASKANSGKVDGNTNVEIVSGTLGITTSIMNQNEDNGNGIYAGGYNDKTSDFDSSAVVTGNTNLIFGGKTDGSIVVGNEKHGIQDVNYCAGSYRSTILGNANLTLENGSKMTHVDRYGNTSGPTLYGGGLEDYINGTVEINVSGGKNMQWKEYDGDSKGDQGGVKLYLGGKKNINNAINKDGAVIKNKENKPYAVILNMSGGSLAQVYGKENVTSSYSKYEGILGDVKMNISGESTEVAEIYGSYSNNIETSNENSKSEIEIENQAKFRSVQNTEKLKLINIGTTESEAPIKTLQCINHLTIDSSHVYVGYKAWYSEATNKTESMPWVKNLTLNNSVLHTDNNAITTIKNHKNTGSLRPDLGASVTMKESSWIADEVIQIYGSMNMENSKLILRSNAIDRNVLTAFNMIKQNFHAKNGELYLNTVNPKNGNYDNNVDTDPKKVIRLQINGKATGDCKVFTTKNGQGPTLEKPEINGNYIIANTQSNFDTFQLANEDAIADGLAFVKKYGYIKEATGGSNISKKFATMWQIGNTPVPNYNVTYNFVSGTTGKGLPNEITNLLPIDSTKYVEGNTINAIQPNNTEVTVSDGIWKFKGYDANSKIANTDNADKNRIIKFTGTWEFKLNEYKIDYRFVSSNKDKELPKEIMDKLPTSGSIEHGKTATPPQTKYEDVKVTDGVWAFKGWTPDKHENVTSNVEFVGTWEFKKNASVINHIPTINTNDKTLTVGDKFDPMNDVTANDIEEGDLTKEIEILENNVDTSKAGVYKITYKITDSQGASAIKTIYITVNPKLEGINNIPTINTNDKTLTIGDKFDSMNDVTAKDIEDGDLTKEIKILENNVDTRKAGVYEITYKVTDNQGASSIKTIYITVNPKMEGINNIPTINASDKTLTVGDKFDPMKDVTAKDIEDGDLTKEIKILENNVDTRKAGVYEITYKVTDNQGASSIKKIKVIIKGKDTSIILNGSDKPNKLNTNKSEDAGSVVTGVKTNMTLWTILLIISGIGALSIFSIYRKKRKINQ